MAEARRRVPEWWPVARWEFMRVVRRGDFVVSLLLAPVLVAGISFGSALIAKRAAKAGVKLALVSGSELVSPTRAPFDSIPGVTWVATPEPNAGPAALERAIAGRTIEGAVVVPAGFARGDSVRVLTRRSEPSWVRKLREPLLEAARKDRAIAAGAHAPSLETLEDPVAIGQRAVNPAAGSERGNRLVGFLFVMLLLASIYTTAAYLGVSISGEKSARVTEIIVSAIRPQAWIDGKLAAFTAIGLLTTVVWGASVAGLAIFLSWRLPEGLSAGAIATDFVYLALGFAFYVALFAAILATIKDIQSTSKIQAYLYFLPVIPFIFLEPILENPESAWSMGLSWVPFFSPTLMPSRIAVGAVAPWEHAIALLLLLVATHFMRIAAGHSFRIGMLMYGKEVSLPELVHWARSK